MSAKDSVGCVAVIGVGRIGLPIACTMARRGFTVLAYDKAISKVQKAELAEAGALPSDDLVAAVERADVIVTILPSSDDVRSVLLSDAVISHADCVAVCVDMSTGLPAKTREIASELWLAKGVPLIDAPICKGGVGGAKAAELTLMVGGDEGAFELCRPLLESISSKVAHVGGVGMGQTIKLLSNYLVHSSVALVSEAYSLSAAAGIPPARAADLLRDCAAEVCLNLRHISKVLLEQRDDATVGNFRLELARKDLKYFASYAADLGVLHLIASMAEHYYLLPERAGLSDVEASTGPWAFLNGRSKEVFHPPMPHSDGDANAASGR